MSLIPLEFIAIDIQSSNQIVSTRNGSFPISMNAVCKTAFGTLQAEKKIILKLFNQSGLYNVAESSNRQMDQHDESEIFLFFHPLLCFLNWKISIFF